VLDCTRAIEIQSDYSKAFNRRGRAYFHQGKYEFAHADYMRTLQLDPNNSDANGDLK
jgi:hypothetical protein